MLTPGGRPLEACALVMSCPPSWGGLRMQPKEEPPRGTPGPVPLGGRGGRWALTSPHPAMPDLPPPLTRSTSAPPRSTSRDRPCGPTATALQGGCPPGRAPLTPTPAHSLLCSAVQATGRDASSSSGVALTS